MTLKQFEELIKDKYEVTKMAIHTSYVLRFGKKGSVILQYCNNEFKKCIVGGKEKEKIEKLLSIKN